MLEVMVALLVLSIGLLGMAAMQVVTAKYRVNVQAHAVVMQLVSDFSERLRINPHQTGSAFAADAAVEAPNAYVLKTAWADQQSTNLAYTKNCFTQACSETERAAFDLMDWRIKVRSSLPQGAAWVEGNRQKGFDITLMWMDKEHTETTKDEDSGAFTVSAVNAKVCPASDSARVVQNCCPEEAVVPAGGRCWRYTVLP